MTPRGRSVRRIADAQKKRQQTAEWKLTEIERRAADLHETQQALVRFVSEDHPFAGLFPSAMTGRLKSLAREIAQAAQARDAQAEAVREETGRAKHAERLVQAQVTAERRAAETRQLTDVIEQAAGRPASSP